MENPGTIHVGFAFGYDTAWILGDMPLALRLQLRDNNEVIWSVKPTEKTARNRYTIRYLPHKWLEIRGYDWTSGRNGYIKIYDVFTFFQSSFIKALESRGIEVPELVKTGKASRADFQYSDIEEVRLYCQLELEGTVMLMNQLRDDFEEAGIWVTQFHGPGAVANSIFKEHRVRDYMGGPPALEIETAAQHAYFGGHFEQYRAGHYQGKVYLYDINSAYPFHIAKLPSLEGATWEHVEHFEDGMVGMFRCSYDDQNNDYRKPHLLPWRGKGGVVGFPTHNTSVWLWHPEAKYATEIHEGWVLHVKDPTLPFSFVEGMYTTRKRWQDEGRGGERALKLGLNSLYGKMAQRVGGNPEKNGGRPSWHKLEWAGLVTSSTRARILEAVELAGDSVIAVETDSITTTKPLDLDIGTGLGQWRLTEYDWITYLQSGIYFTSKPGDGNKAKTRGIDVTQLHYDKVLEFLDGDQEKPLLVTTRQFIGLGNPRQGLYGQWQDGTKEVRVAGQKRVHVPEFCPACKEGLSMATNLHQLIAAPQYGIRPSEPHSLPWLGQEVAKGPDDLEYVGDAPAGYSGARHEGTQKDPAQGKGAGS
jgi:hypothetical protein